MTPEEEDAEVRRLISVSQGSWAQAMFPAAYLRVVGGEQPYEMGRRLAEEGNAAWAEAAYANDPVMHAEVERGVKDVAFERGFAINSINDLVENPRLLPYKAYPNSFGLDDIFLYVSPDVFFLLLLLTDNGRKGLDSVCKCVNPIVLKYLDMLGKTMVSMIQTSTKNPILALPATLLFTNMAERAWLIDHPTAAIVATTVSGVAFTKSVLQIITDIPKDIFKGILAPAGDITFDVGDSCEL